MSLIVVATTEELRLLTKQERLVYELYRHEGKKKEEICIELKITSETFRRYWWSAIKKIIEHRRLTANPQLFMSQGKDVLGSHATFGQRMPYDPRTITNQSKMGNAPVAPPDGENDIDKRP